MDSPGDVMNYVRRACRNYPGLLTAAEVVGRAFLLLGRTLGTREKVRVLVEGLHKNELRKLLHAANEVTLHCTSVNSFRLGVVFRPDEKDTGGIAFEDQEIPMSFVQELKRTLEKSEFDSAAAS